MVSDNILPPKGSEAFDDFRFAGTGTARQEEFIAELIGFLRKNFPDDVGFLEDGMLDTRVCWGIGRARSHGMTLSRSIARFVILMVIAGPKFDESPLIRSCLEDSSVPPDERIDLMLRRVTPEQWDELRQNSRQRDWAEADALPDRFPGRYYRS